jgi:hypothetical protein
MKDLVVTKNRNVILFGIKISEYKIKNKYKIDEYTISIYTAALVLNNCLQ